MFVNVPYHTVIYRVAHILRHYALHLDDLIQVVSVEEFSIPDRTVWNRCGCYVGKNGDQLLNMTLSFRDLTIIKCPLLEIRDNLNYNRSWITRYDRNYTIYYT